MTGDDRSHRGGGTVNAVTPRRISSAVLALATALALTACSGSDDPQADGPAATETPSPTPAPGTTPTQPGATDTAPTETAGGAVVTVPEALRFTAPLVGGGEFDGAEYAGAPVAFWFWAPF
jgi:hypothetical protein